MCLFRDQRETHMLAYTQTQAWRPRQRYTHKYTSTHTYIQTEIQMHTGTYTHTYTYPRTYTCLNAISRDTDTHRHMFSISQTSMHTCTLSFSLALSRNHSTTHRYALSNQSSHPINHMYLPLYGLFRDRDKGKATVEEDKRRA